MGSLTNALIAINIAVFLLVFSMPAEMMESAFSMLSFTSSMLLEPWRIITSMFLHASASHLFFNMLGLYFFGRVVEKEFGGRNFAAMYFISGAAGSLAFGLTSAMEAVGASGCIFGLMGAAMLAKPKEWVRIFVFPLPMGIVAILYIVTQAALAVIPLGDSGIAYVAHIGGMIAGALIAFRLKPKDSIKGVMWLVALLLLLILLWPVISIAVAIGQAILSVVDLILGFAIYGVAKLLLSWIWVVI